MINDLRLPSLRIKQVIQSVVLHAEKRLVYAVRNVMLILYGPVVLYIFTGYDLTSAVTAEVRPIVKECERLVKC